MLTRIVYRTFVQRQQYEWIFANCGTNTLSVYSSVLRNPAKLRLYLQHADQQTFIRVPRLRRAVTRLPRNAGRGLIWIYRHTLSLLVGYNCRHLPTCSVYGDEAIERFGLWGGGWMTLARLLRCHPFGTSGIDNVPQERPPGARWYLPWRYGRWRGVNAP